MLSGTGTIVAGSNGAKSSNIDVILSRPSPSLTDLLDCADVLLRRLHEEDERLSRYLCQPKVAEQLVMLAVGAKGDARTEHVACADTARHSFVACEVLCADIPRMTEVLSGNDELLYPLFASFPSSSKPIEHWCRVIKSLLHRMPLTMFEQFAKHNPLEHILRHLNERFVMDVMFKLVSLFDYDVPVVLFLEQHAFFLRLLDLLQEGEEHRLAVPYFIGGLVSTSFSNQLVQQLLQQMLTSKWQQRILDLILTGEPAIPNSTLVSGVDVLVEVFASLFDDRFRGKRLDLSPMRAAFATALPRLSSLFLGYSKLYPPTHQSTGIAPRLGMERLKLFRLLSYLPLICDDRLASIMASLSFPKRFTVTPAIFRLPVCLRRMLSGHLRQTICCIRHLSTLCQTSSPAMVPWLATSC